MRVKYSKRGEDEEEEEEDELLSIDAVGAIVLVVEVVVELLLFVNETNGNFVLDPMLWLLSMVLLIPLAGIDVIVVLALLDILVELVLLSRTARLTSGG